MGLGVVFFGTPAFAGASLERLLHSPHQVLAVVTQPDRPRGRGHRVLPSPVKIIADAHHIPILQPERFKDEAFRAAVQRIPADLGIVAAYGRILPEWILAWPRLGTINVHASLLPRWRGAAPIHRAVLAGDRETGITIMRVVPALDAGPMLARRALAIDPDETSVELEARLAPAGADLLIAVVDRLEAGPVSEVPQDDGAATYAARLERNDSRVDWARPARTVHDQIRGLQPWPLAEVLFHGRRLLLLRSTVLQEEVTSASPGTILAASAAGIDVAALPGVVRLTEIKMEGRPPMTARAFLNGHPIASGDRFDALPVRP
jgi:methionyl-tRNA formyltransferase